MGGQMTVDEVMDVVLKDKHYYFTSGGGLTVSGGEPFLQPAFLLELLKQAKSVGISTAVETCGCVGWESIRHCLPYLDLIQYDCKHVDEEKHKAWTGASTVVIKENLQRIAREYTGELVVRIPYIPGFNDTEAEQEAIYRFVATLEGKHRIEVLPFHRFGATKYEGLGREYSFSKQDPVKKASIEHLVGLGNKCGVDVMIDAL